MRKQKGHKKTRQRAMFAGAGPTIFAAGVLNFCVRDVNRCIHSAIATGSVRDRSLKTKQRSKDSLIKSSTY